MYRAGEGLGEHGEEVAGPPWILGHRGAPREAPENTLVGLQLAIDRGLDGVEYDLRACATGEPVLIHDERLERTTDGAGPVGRLTLPELAGLDAGGWFHKRFAGQPLPLFEEALEIGGELERTPLHVIDVKDPALVGEVAARLRRLPQPLSVRIASFQRNVCLEARDLGLAPILIAYEAREAEHRFVRDERIAAFACPPDGWRTPAGALDWSCEAWVWGADRPDDLLAACRRPVFGIVTNEPLRALATRALASLTPHDDGPFPLRVPELEVPQPGDGAPRGEWAGRWEPRVTVRNAFPFPVELAVALEIRGGAFEVQGLPISTRLAVGETRELDLSLVGGSWSPCEDPVVHARFVWREGPGRPRRSLVLDAPLERVRTLRLASGAQRVPMLRERPGDPYASMTVRRRGNELVAWVEDPGGLSDVRAMMRLGPRIRTGSRGVRLLVPGHERAARTAVPFDVGFDGVQAGEAGNRRLRRWAGGLPLELRSGAPGRLFLERPA